MTVHRSTQCVLHTDYHSVSMIKISMKLIHGYKLNANYGANTMVCFLFSSSFNKNDDFIIQWIVLF